MVKEKISRRDKIDLIKQVTAGTMGPEVIKYLLGLINSSDRHRIFHYDDVTGEISPQDRAEKELHDKLPEKYKAMFTYSLHDESCRDLGDEIEGSIPNWC